MSRRRRPPQRRPAQRARPATSPPASRLPPRASADPITAYRDAAGYGRSIRVALLAAVLLLDLSLIIRASRHDAPPAIGAAGLAAMAFFFAAVFIRHLVALHRIRSSDPGLLQPSRSLMIGMLQAPFGVANPRAMPFDRIVLRATVALGAALPPLIIIAGALNRS